MSHPPFSELKNSGNAPITRRTFTKTLLVTLALPWQLTTADHITATGWPAWLLAVTGDPIAVIRLGRAYLEFHPEEQGANHLIRLIHEALGHLSDLEPDQIEQPAEFTHALKRLVRTDYVNDDVVSLQGWVLSRTEARLYALMAVLES